MAAAVGEIGLGWMGRRGKSQKNNFSEP